MSNSIFDWPASLKRFVRFTTAKSEDVNDAFDELSAGLDTVEATIARSLKLPTGAGEQTINLSAAQRANLLLSFDALGNVTAIAGGGRYRGDWVTATLYVVSDYVRDPVSKNIYSTVTQHTSGVLATDIAAGRLQLAIDVADVEAQRALAQAAATTATTQAGIATTKASEAAQSAIDATNNGAAQVAIATAQADLALTRANNADTARAAAVVAKDAAELAYDQFDDRFLGPKGSDPTLDNDGNALLEGALYWSTSSKQMRVWDGTAWAVSFASLAGTVLKAGDSMTGALNDAATLTLASAATTAIGGQNSNNLSITGTTTITSFGTVAAGVRRRLIFAGALILTHNATSLILPSGANITTAAGDVAEMLSLGGGNWRCISYMRASGQSVVAVSQSRPYTDIAVNTTAVRFTRYRLTATLTLTLPASPADGDWVEAFNNSGTTTPIVGRNAQNINGLAEDFVIDRDWASVTFVFRAGYGWMAV